MIARAGLPALMSWISYSGGSYPLHDALFENCPVLGRAGKRMTGSNLGAESMIRPVLPGFTGVAADRRP